MNSIYKILILLMVISIGGMTLSCTDDDASGGMPVVDFIRTTDPESSDSLVVIAGQGQMVVIVGENLQTVQEVYFNDRKALLIATRITNNNVIVQVPSELPTVVTNQAKMIFANGDSLLFNFWVRVNQPRIDRMKSEYVSDEGEAVFYGDYFYEPLSVTFNGDLDAEIVSVKDTELRVKVPIGAQVGTIKIASNFGETESDFWFRDDRNIIIGVDIPLDNGLWRGYDFVESSDPVVENINGNFLRIDEGSKGAWPYLEIYGGPASADSNVDTRKIPADAIENPGNYNLKFEINTIESAVGATMRLHLGNSEANFGDDRSNIFYAWESNLDTHGEWETVTIPWSNVYSENQFFAYNSTGYSVYIYFHGPNAAIHNMALDNIRVVPN